MSDILRRIIFVTNRELALKTKSPLKDNCRLPAGDVDRPQHTTDQFATKGITWSRNRGGTAVKESL